VQGICYFINKIPKFIKKIEKEVKGKKGKVIPVPGHGGP
jgi:hypothetical protein